MSLLRKTMQASLMKNRFFSSAVIAAESPKITIARHLLLLKQIAAAKDEAKLDELSRSGLPTIDLNNLSSDFDDFKSYFALSTLQKGDKFIPDPTAWQNMDALSFASTELQRAETWPFFVGFVSVLLVLGVGIGASLPKEGRVHSKYVQLLEGRREEH